MISIIVCSREVELLNKLKKNISETIGCAFEIVTIDNSNNHYNIFEAYNLGVKKSKGEILCFAHEDILFYTNDWGLKLLEHFKLDAQLGLIGTVGSTALPGAPAPWWNRHKVNTHYIHLLQKWQPGDNIKRWSYNEPYKDTSLIYHKENDTSQNINQVTSVDGFFMAIPKHLFNHIKFDTDTFDGFHCYDLDICMQVNKANYKVAVAHNILIAHLSSGSVSNHWAEASIVFTTKWKKHLPHSIKQLTIPQKDNYTNSLLLTFCYWNYKRLSNGTIRQVIFNYLKPSNFFNDEEYRILKIWSHSNYAITRIFNKLFKRK
ncbi:Glycosyltransferase like family protein [Saccharicrinis carchari]|uniref:Glycosyltransferase like family protein n=1 Tax=Saccharicrinis carchari TaxID=1168039 RepID=A0A521AKJ2_SACCC|nr:glycosyltransferase [Saccharicrinis carchari]SMO35328.1 Glycosyltransferase like family protein [Saccharicrinis carchari]